MAFTRSQAVLPLHSGKAPAWLYTRMVRLARPFVKLSISEHGSRGMLERLASAHYLQALGSLLGFDWHASGLTTTTTSALRDAFNSWKESPIRVAGGKGRTALTTPRLLREHATAFSLDAEPYVYASRMIARVDNTLVQDGARLYHHTFFLDEHGLFTVIQQGLNAEQREARRYHWYSHGLKDYTREPHQSLIAERKHRVLNLTSMEHDQLREDILKLFTEDPERLVKRFTSPLYLSTLRMPRSHWLRSYYLKPASRKLLARLSTAKPETMEMLVQQQGVGVKAFRAFALTARLLYGSPVSWRDPAVYAYAHGGKDGTPYPVDKRTYEQTIQLLETAARQSLEGREKQTVLKRLAQHAERAASM